MDRDDQRAAPPDDAGHRGSQTRPEDTVEMGPTDPRPDADSEGHRHPPLHRDPIDPQDVPRAVMPISGLGWMIALIVLILIVAYIWSIGRF